MNNYFLILFFIVSSAIYSNGTKWEIALPGRVLTTPVERKKGDLILICEDRRLYSIDIKNGKVLWKIKPGGKLQDFVVSKDGSILVWDQLNIYSVYSNGEIRWTLNVPSGFDSNLTSNELGDIFYVSADSLYKVDRFGKKFHITDNIYFDTLESLENSLIGCRTKTGITAVTGNGVSVWNYNTSEKPLTMKSVDDNIFLIYKNGYVEKISDAGAFIKSWDTGNENIYKNSLNSDNQLLITGDRGISLITENEIRKHDSLDTALYYSEGLTITTSEDWTIKCEESLENHQFFPSGRRQIINTTISLGDKRVWKDERLQIHYRELISDNNRESQKYLLDYIDKKIGQLDLLVEIPNFYEILLLLSADTNKNQDIRIEAYKAIGKSRDISFVPYLLEDLEDESSYIVIPYIFYALGAIGSDTTGRVIAAINSKIDSYFDETLAINGLYALYRINNYTNGEWVDSVFSGIELILKAGYSQNIKNRCYDILNRLK